MLCSAPKSIRLSIPTSMRLVSVTRQYVIAVLSSLSDDSDAIERIGLASHELMENAIKYSVDGCTQFEIEFCDRENPVPLYIRTSNHSSAELLADLTARLDELARVSEPLRYYDEMIVRSLQQEGSGLGLARIRAEGEMPLDYSVVDGVVTIIARTSLRLREAP